MSGTSDCSRQKEDAVLYLDTNVFIYLIEGSPEISGPIETLFRQLALNPGFAVTRKLTLAELLAPTHVAGAMPRDTKRKLCTKLLLSNPAITSVPVSQDVLIATADLRAVLRQKLPDAIHVVTALQTKCRLFMSGDRDAKRLPAGLIQIRPNLDGRTTVLERLHG